MTTVVAIITAIGSILAAISYFYKEVKSTPEQKKQKIDEKVGEAKDNFENSGRPSE